MESGDGVDPLMRDLVVIGTSGHARSCLDILATTGWNVLGCIGAPPTGRLQADYLGDDGVLNKLIATGVRHAVVAVGDNQTRDRLTTDLVRRGLNLPAVVSTQATVSPTASIGAGCVVMHGVVIGPYTTLGTAVIVNTAATIDHDCEVSDFVHVAPGVHLAGGITLRAGAFLGVGASVTPGLVIGEWARVGAGAAVIRDVGAGLTVAGVPARELPRVPGHQADSA
jgi:sugar O-acyltransferase (sialic acid O-acetyltransferase NeuD family)